MRDMSGTISQNAHKKESKHPDIKGKCSINGQEYNIGGWLKQSQSGDEFYSLSFSVREANHPKEEIKAKPMFSGKPKPQEDFHNDEVPF